MRFLKEFHLVVVKILKSDCAHFWCIVGWPGCWCGPRKTRYKICICQVCDGLSNVIWTVVFEEVVEILCVF
jgi:hypothetical protein